MQLRWTEEAADDLEHIADYLFVNTPAYAADLVSAIHNAPSVLTTFP
jgi:plasmid stabilization system protein ParE